MADIFLSYRRDDSSAATKLIYDSLCHYYDEHQIFRDIETIGPGELWEQRIKDELLKCTAVLVIIGRNWLTIADENDRRRLDNVDDWVRKEISLALSNSRYVIPILVDGAQLPKADDLPYEIKGLTGRNAFEISYKRVKYDTDELVKQLIRWELYPLKGTPKDPPDPYRKTITEQENTKASALVNALLLLEGIGYSVMLTSSDRSFGGLIIAFC